MNIMNMLLMASSITLILIILSKTINESKTESKEKSSTFECGFDSQSMKNNNISGQFFMIALLFIIFDMEISLMIPLLNNMNADLKVNWILIMLILLLLLSTLMEWKKGLIEWVK